MGGIGNNAERGPEVTSLMGAGPPAVAGMLGAAPPVQGGAHRFASGPHCWRRRDAGTTQVQESRWWSVKDVLLQLPHHAERGQVALYSLLSPHSMQQQ